MIIFSDHFHFITSCSRFGSLLGADTPSSHTPSTDGAAATLPRSSIVVMLPNGDRLAPSQSERAAAVPRNLLQRTKRDPRD
jgi:hypothetical protein